MALTDNLQAFYKLSDTSDSSGNNRTLTNNGNVSFASGKIGNAAVFDGSNYLTTPSYSFGSNDLAITAWFKPTIEGQFGTILSNNGVAYGDGLYGIGSGDKSDGFLRLYCVNADTSEGGAAIVANDAVTFNAWNHVAIIKNATELSMWFNGVKQSKTINGFSGNFDEGISKQHAIGTSYYNEFFAGQIDAVGIWNRALSDAEVAELYNSGNGGEIVDGAWVPAPPPPTLVKMQAPVKFFGKVKFGV
jgi:hypothetical protein